eukprot:Nk52_evm24s2273 gene=Nk52_evmTU24s2273
MPRLFLKRDMELEDAIHTSILTLKEGFEGQLTEHNIEVGIVDGEGFRQLTPSEIKDYLASIIEKEIKSEMKDAALADEKWGRVDGS